jgi:hypothetical protein
MNLHADFWAPALVALALLSTGIVYGTDMFFALVGRTALRRADAASLTQVMGHLHAVADARMPVAGALAMLSTTGLFFAAGGWAVWAGRLALLALGGLLTMLGLYARVAQPVNQRLTAAAQQGTTLPDAPALQARWDSVIGLRAAALTVAMAALIAAALLLPGQ